MNKKHLTSTVPAHKEHLRGTVPVRVTLYQFWGNGGKCCPQYLEAIMKGSEGAVSEENKPGLQKELQKLVSKFYKYAKIQRELRK